MLRVLVTPIMLHELAGPYRDVLRSGGFEVVYPPEGLSLQEPAALVEQLQAVEAVIASVEPYTREVLAASKLRVVARNGVGYDSVDVPAATELGIAVTITPGVNQQAVAEHTLALMLAVMHGFPAQDREARSGSWQLVIRPRLAGKTLGLVGMGAIGKAVAPMAKGLGLEVLACDPLPDRQFAARCGVELCSFDQLLARADIISLHLPCTPETTDIINAQTLARIKPGAVLVNTSRGGLVDEDALVEALRSGQLGAAALDVFKTEPLPSDSPLVGMDNVLLSPHTAGLDRESMEAMARMAAESIVDLHEGRWPEGRVANREIGRAWKW